MKTHFVCQECGATYSKWQGQCHQCREWNTLAEEVLEDDKKKKKHLKSKSDLEKIEKNAQIQKKVISFSQVESVSGSKTRFSTGINEIDRVLGGGLVKGELILIGGEPGIGKSTILTQLVIELVAKKDFEQKILYVCGEESPSQIRLRIGRITKNEQKNKKQSLDNILFVSSTDVDEVNSIIQVKKPGLVVIDSIQTLTTEDLTGAAGSIGQIRECSERIRKVVKYLQIPTFLVGHVTKKGTIAGPKVLEHMVDVVLELSGERTGSIRLLRTLKNRFGATDEVGVFKHVDAGLKQVLNPNEVFLENSKPEPGSAIASILEGTRPLLVEVQALVIESQLAMPRRVGRGVKLSRIQFLSAVLQKHAYLPLGSHDIFLSIVGGFQINEPGIDLSLAVVVASSLKNKKIKPNSIFIGEVGLLGEIRPVNFLDKRVEESKRLGYENIYCSKTHTKVNNLFKDLGLI